MGPFDRPLAPTEPSRSAVHAGLVDRPVPLGRRDFSSRRKVVGAGKLAEAADDNDELRIAARMASALPSEQIGAILSLVLQFPKRSAPALDDLAGEVRKIVADRYAKRRAYEQGELAARHVRDHLGLAPGEPCDIRAVLDLLGVGIDFRSVEPATLRALAIDGRAHGPVAFVNMKGAGRVSGRNPSENGSVRVDLAHELCHLLLDRGHALGAVEILNSRMPIEIEQRAKSFAGELLAPTEAVSTIWRDRGTPRSLKALKTLVLHLQRAFGVTKAVAAWKLQHATEFSMSTSPACWTRSLLSAD